MRLRRAGLTASAGLSCYVYRGRRYEKMTFFHKCVHIGLDVLLP